MAFLFCAWLPREQTVKKKAVSSNRYESFKNFYFAKYKKKGKEIFAFLLKTTRLALPVVGVEAALAVLVYPRFRPCRWWKRLAYERGDSYRGRLLYDLGLGIAMPLTI